jgi:hypothetical protein
MTIEQRPELNRFVDSSIPVTWAKRWRAFKLAFPIWMFACVSVVEMGIFVTTSTGQFSWDKIMAMAVGPVVMFPFFWGLFEVQMYFHGHSRRTLTIKDKRIVMNPVKQPSLSWKSIARFQFEPIPENPSLTKLSVFRTHFKRIVRHFALVVEKPAQVSPIIRELEKRRHANAAEFQIIVLQKPGPVPAIALPPVLAMSLTMAGVYLLLHGMALLVIALMPSPHSPGHVSEVRPGLVALLNQLFAEYFPSVEQHRQFLLATGITVTLAGLALMFWRSQLPCGQPQKEGTERS